MDRKKAVSVVLTAFFASSPYLPPEPWFNHAGERAVLHADGTESRSSGDWRAFKHEMADWFSSFRKVFKIGNVHRMTSRLGHVA